MAGRMMALSAAFLGAGAAHAACPIELAVYSDLQNAAEIDFTPLLARSDTPDPESAANRFKVILDNDVVLDGVVAWTGGGGRPRGSLTYGCPSGAVAGGELAACALWQGVIYTADENGAVGLLPAEGNPAPKTLILPDLGPTLRHSAAYGPNGFTTVPWDVFSLSGCQE